MKHIKRNVTQLLLVLSILCFWIISYEKIEAEAAVKTSFSKGVLTISGSGEIASSDLSSLKKDDIKEIIVEKGITGIAESAFEGCKNLEKVTLPEGLTSIGPSAFYGCSSLKTVTIPSTLKIISELAFANCNSLTGELKLPDTLESMGKAIFSRSGITTVKVYKWMTEYHLGDNHGTPYPFSSVIYNYYGINDYTKVTFVNDVTSIPTACFYNATSLKEIVIPEGINSIDDKAFEGCKNLEKVTLPEGLTSIGPSAFYGCSSLKTVTIPSTLKIISELAFANCNSLTGELKLPDTLESMGKAIFSRSGITTVKVYKWMTEYHLGDNHGTPYPFSSVIYNYYGINDYTKVTFVNDVTSIPTACFYNATSLKEIMIPEQISEIGEYAFYGCTSAMYYVVKNSYAEQYFKDNSITYTYWNGIPEENEQSKDNDKIEKLNLTISAKNGSLTTTVTNSLSSKQLNDVVKSWINIYDKNNISELIASYSEEGLLSKYSVAVDAGVYGIEVVYYDKDKNIIAKGEEKSEVALSITNDGLISNIEEGNSATLYGKVTSVNKISTVKVEILDSDGNALQKAVTVKPKAKTFLLSDSSLDNKLKIENLSKGTAIVRVTITDSAKNTLKRDYSISVSKKITIKTSEKKSKIIASFSNELTAKEQKQVAYTWINVYDKECDNCLIFSKSYDNPAVKLELCILPGKYGIEVVYYNSSGNPLARGEAVATNTYSGSINTSNLLEYTIK